METLTIPVKEATYLTVEQRNNARESLTKVILAMTEAAIDNKPVAGDSLMELNKVMELI